MTKTRTTDYLVIGAGSAGSAVAARLAEDEGTTVTLLEAGPTDRHPHIMMPAAMGYNLVSDRRNWFYRTQPEPHLDDRTVMQARGRVLGGSSSINGMNWVRGNPHDYDEWAAMGLKSWSYDSVLPYFKRAETFDRGPNEYRGGDGPMRIQSCAGKNPLYETFLEAGQEMGLPYLDDHNAYRQEGVFHGQRNVHDGIRWNTYQGFVRSQAAKPNLTVEKNARVLKIETSNKRVVRIQAKIDGIRQTFEVEKETILCAGALNSPQLLNLSGIGHADDLKAAGIPLTHHLPGVGRNLQDHLSIDIQYRTTKKVSIAHDLNLLGQAKAGLQWMLFKKGIGVSNFFEVGAFIRTRESEKIANMQVEFIPMMAEFTDDNFAALPGFQGYLTLQRPGSRGRVWVDSADPMASPKFRFNYYEDPDDLEQALEMVKTMRTLIKQSAWDELRGAEVMPGPDVQTDDEIRAWLRTITATNYHPCGTCRMGDDDEAVVDENGRVHGLEALRVVDASIMPKIVTGNLNCPTIMMAEKISDSIRGRDPLPPEPQPYYTAH